MDRGVAYAASQTYPCMSCPHEVRTALASTSIRSAQRLSLPSQTTSNSKLVVTLERVEVSEHLVLHRQFEPTVKLAGVDLADFVLSEPLQAVDNGCR